MQCRLGAGTGRRHHPGACRRSDCGGADMSRVPKPADHVRREHELLYPFLYEHATDPDQVVAEACQSTTAKTREIIDLRTEVCTRSSGLLAACAHDMAARFAVGG